ncbi:MAG: ATP-binding protein [Anaerovorax sp.]
MKKLLILSGKGGTGKTTLTAAFIDFLNARAFADCDVDAPNLHLVAGETAKPRKKEYLGAQKSAINPIKCKNCGACLTHCRFDAVTQTADGYKINEYACEGCGVCLQVCPEHAITLHDDIAGTQLLFHSQRVFSTAKLKMGRGNSGKLVTEVKTALFHQFQPEAASKVESEIAIIDGSPGIGCPVIASISGVDLVLIVAEPSLSGMSDMTRILKTVEIFGTKAAVCINKYDASMENTKTIEQFCEAHNIPFVGCIPYDKQASKAMNAGHSLAQVTCPATMALLEVCKNTQKLLER